MITMTVPFVRLRGETQENEVIFFCIWRLWLSDPLLAAGVVNSNPIGKSLLKNPIGDEIWAETSPAPTHWRANIPRRGWLYVARFSMRTHAKNKLMLVYQQAPSYGAPRILCNRLRGCREVSSKIMYLLWSSKRTASELMRGF